MKEDVIPSGLDNYNSSEIFLVKPNYKEEINMRTFAVVIMALLFVSCSDLKMDGMYMIQNIVVQNEAKELTDLYSINMVVFRNGLIESPPSLKGDVCSNCTFESSGVNSILIKCKSDCWLNGLWRGKKKIVSKYEGVVYHFDNGNSSFELVQ